VEKREKKMQQESKYRENTSIFTDGTSGQRGQLLYVPEVGAQGKSELRKGLLDNDRATTTKKVFTTGVSELLLRGTGVVPEKKSPKYAGVQKKHTLP